MVARALGYEGTHHQLLAAVVEFIHTATLLHDDVVDESDLRRGRDTANAVFGNAASVLVGDYLYSRSFEMMVEAGSMRIMSILSEATTVIAEGEVLQLLNVHDPDVSQERYLQVVRYKTAKLFEAAAQVGAVLAGATPSREAAAAAYGRHVGTAFQLVDDVLDYRGDAAALGERGRRPARRQAHAAADPRHGSGHARAAAIDPRRHQDGRRRLRRRGRRHPGHRRAGARHAGRRSRGRTGPQCPVELPHFRFPKISVRILRFRGEQRSLAKSGEAAMPNLQ